MTVLVLGAGVIGLTTAYALHRAGETVHVIERLEGPGLATSFGNAGGLCPGFAGPWAAPGMVGKALRWMFQPSAPLKIRPRLDLDQWRWLLSFAQECNAQRSAANKRAMQAIAHYSQTRLFEVIAEANLVFDHGRGGVLQTFRSDKTRHAGEGAAKVLAGLGIPHRFVEPDEIAQVEPALARSRSAFTGALHLSDDGTGDCAAFCTALAAWLSAEGVQFSYGTNVMGLALSGNRIVGVEAPAGRVEADAIVLTTGPFSNSLLRPLGLAQRIYPVKGYSLTYELPVEEAAANTYTPRSSVMDEDSKLMFTRLGNRLRVGGVAELAGFDDRLDGAQIGSIRDQTTELFPDLSDTREPLPWCGFRPMTPDGRARIGPAPGIDGLWLNIGHGSNGWTQAAGAGQLVADMMSGKSPAIDCAAFLPN